MAIKRISAVAKEKSTRTGSKFLVWNIKKNDGTWVHAKMTKDVNNIPKNPGRYDIIADTAQMNKSSDDFGEVWWFREVQEFAEPETSDEAETQF